ncbi:MAG: 2-dehydropantoate 2-reductase [Desulfobacterales bacterium]|nr:MAG: 2-dehydropantoate 2-reductase [Desulfobacterales bacterium]
MKIQRISIIGAGAMGAAYAALFSDAGDFAVSFVARGERYRRLKQGALTINGKPYVVPVIHPDEVTEPADLILVALKHHHLPEPLQDIKALVGDDTTMLSVMNGLESEEMIGSVCGMDKMVYAIAVGIDAVREGNRFTYASPGKIIFGAGPHAAGGHRLDRLRDALNRAGIPNAVPTDMMRMLWWKFMINVGINQASAVLRASYGVFQSSPDAQALMQALMQEVLALAQKIDIDLTPKDLDEWSNILSTLAPTGKTSMLQDIEAGRKTEVEIFAGKMVSMGAKHHVPTPVNETVLRIIKVIESEERQAAASA